MGTYRYLVACPDGGINEGVEDPVPIDAASPRSAACKYVDRFWNRIEEDVAFVIVVCGPKAHTTRWKVRGRMVAHVSAQPVRSIR